MFETSNELKQLILWVLRLFGPPRVRITAYPHLALEVAIEGSDWGEGREEPLLLQLQQRAFVGGHSWQGAISSGSS